jgi:hypothetical protein
MLYHEKLIQSIIELSKEIGKNEHVLENSKVPVYADAQMDILGEVTEEKMRELDELEQKLLAVLENNSSTVIRRILQRIFESHLGLNETTYKIVKIIKEVEQNND